MVMQTTGGLHTAEIVCPFSDCALMSNSEQRRNATIPPTLVMHSIVVQRGVRGVTPLEVDFRPPPHQNF